jgi:hypothetical protein
LISGDFGDVVFHVGLKCQKLKKNYGHQQTMVNWCQQQLCPKIFGDIGIDIGIDKSVGIG